jgi:phospholipase/carboxylesterase
VLRALALVVVLVTSLSGAAAAGAPARAEPLPYKEIVTGGAAPDAELPLVVALHGRGDTPEGFAPLFEGWMVRARIVIPRPPHPWGGGGHAWTPHDHVGPEKRAAIASDLLALSDRVVATADAVRRARRTRGPAVVMGFSQGGMMAWTIAVRHPRAFVAVFPVAGFLVPEVLARQSVAGVRLPAIVAFHGSADPLVALADDKKGVRLLEQQGGRAELRVHDGLGHTIPRADVLAAIAAALSARGDAAGQK